MLDLKPLPPKDAIAFFRSKGLRIGFDYRDVWQDEHARDFTVAKAMSIDILEDIRAALDKAQVEGLPFEQFRKQLAPILQAKGWWGRKDMVDPLTGQTVAAQLGSDRRLRTIFNTNMRQAYNAGNWTRAQQVKADLPYLLYHHNDVRFPRPEHVAWDGVCLPVDHVFWKTHYPQCAWGCKCSTESVSKRMLIDRGLRVTADADIPTFPKIEYVNKRTGEISQVERGIDPAFNFNIGASPLRPITAVPAPPPPGVANLYHTEATPQIRSFLETVGAEHADRVVVDAHNWPVSLGPSLFVDASGEPRVPRPDLPGTLPLVGRALASAARKGSWLWSDDVSALSPAQDRGLDRLWQLATAKGPYTNETVGLFRSPAWFDKLAAEAGIKPGLSHTIDGDAARHIFDHHGDAIKEASRGQIAVTLADLRRIPEIVMKADQVAFGLVDDRHNPAIGFVRRGAEADVVYVVEIRRHALAAKTMIKFPAGASESQINEALRLNVRNDNGELPTLVQIAGEINLPLPALVRRYTIELDNQAVTVDFSDGTWTYDVRALSGG